MGSIRPLLGWNWVGIGQDFDATTRTSFWGRIVTTIIIRVISRRRERTRGVCLERKVAWDRFLPRMPRTTRTSGGTSFIATREFRISRIWCWTLNSTENVGRGQRRRVFRQHPFDDHKAGRRARKQTRMITFIKKNSIELSECSGLYA